MAHENRRNLSPFSKTGTGREGGGARRIFTPAAAVFALALALGVIVVLWRSQIRADAGRGRAQTEAMARAAALELQLTRAVRASELLAAQARQSGGAIPHFQKFAGELLGMFPELASLELQPGGVVREIAPRTGNERAIGSNVLKDPAHGPGAVAAMQSRSTRASAPLRLYNGEPGLVITTPIFQATRDNQQRFWGFVAVSVRLSDVAKRAGLHEVAARGYDYLLFTMPTAGKAVPIAGQGISRLQDTVQHPLRIYDLEFRLALRPRGGWSSGWSVLFECVGVLMVAGILSWAAHATSGRRELELALAQAQRQILSEAGEREGVQRQLAETQTRAQAELAKVQAALRQAEDQADEIAEKLHTATAAREVAESGLKELQTHAGELEKQLKKSAQAEKDFQNRQAELDDARSGRQAAEEKCRDLEEALSEAGRAEAAARNTLAQKEAEGREALSALRHRLEQQESAAAEAVEISSTRLKQAEAENERLKNRLELLERALKEVTQTRPAVEIPEERAPASPQSPEVSPHSTDAPAVPLPESRVSEAHDDWDSQEFVPREGGSGAVGTPPPYRDTAGAVGTPAPYPETAGAVGTPPPEPKPVPPLARRKRSRRTENNQPELFGSEPPARSAAPSLAGDSAESNPESGDEDLDERSQVTAGVVAGVTEDAEPAPTREPARNADVEVAELRQVANQILPLLADGDPGAKDCFKANRKLFRSALSEAAFEEFEGALKAGKYDAALEQLRKAVRKYGLHL